MHAITFDRISKGLKYALMAGACLYVVVYILIALARIQYPFELEWLEGNSLDYVKRILSGQRVYVAPSLEFVPGVYTPLYFYLSAIVASVTGVGFLPLRLVSFTASLACFVLIFLIVKRETSSSYAGVISAGLFAATFRISGAWFDLARVDSLYLCFLLAALYLVKFQVTIPGYVLAGVCVSLSFLTKQSALLVCLPIMLYAAFSNWRLSFFFIGTAILGLAGSTWVLDSLHDGWYTYYIFDFTRHPIMTYMFRDFWTQDIVSPLLLGCAFSIYYLIAQLPNSVHKSSAFFFLAAIGMVGASWAGVLNWGGYNNVLFSAYAIIAILFGLGAHRALSSIRLLPGDERPAMEILILVLCIGQFALLLYNPIKQIPTQKDLAAGKELVSKIEQTRGEVLVYSHGYLAAMAGKTSSAQSLSVFDILGLSPLQDESQVGRKLVAQVRQALREKRYSLIILDSYGGDSEWLLEDIKAYYVEQGRVFDDPSVFWPVTGTPTRPEFIYTPG